jgi:hypothetical protein
MIQRGSGMQQRRVRNISVTKTNLSIQEQGGVSMRTRSPAYQATYVIGIYLTFAYSTV